MSKIKVAFIGCGGIAKSHLQKLMTFDDIEFVGFYSNNIENASAFSQKAGQGRAFDCYTDMYDMQKPDAVYICTIPSAHGDFELEAIKRGINIFVEKPLSINLEIAEKIEKEARKARIITCVGYQERYLDIIHKTKSYLEGRKIGLVQGSYLGGMPGVYWWRQLETSGGQIVEQSTHIFDMLRYLIGEAESVYCSGGKGIINNVPNYNIEDYSSAVVTFKNGIIANVFTGCYLSSGLQAPNGIKFYAADATIEYNARKSVKFQSADESEEYLNENDINFAINRTFIDAIKSGERSRILSDYADAVKSLKLTFACNDSIKTGLPVFL